MRERHRYQAGATTRALERAYTAYARQDKPFLAVVEAETAAEFLRRVTELRDHLEEQFRAAGVL